MKYLKRILHESAEFYPNVYYLSIEFRKYRYYDINIAVNYNDRNVFLWMLDTFGDSDYLRELLLHIVKMRRYQILKDMLTVNSNMVRFLDMRDVLNVILENDDVRAFDMIFGNDILSRISIDSWSIIKSNAKRIYKRIGKKFRIDLRFLKACAYSKTELGFYLLEKNLRNIIREAYNIGVVTYIRSCDEFDSIHLDILKSINPYGYWDIENIGIGVISLLFPEDEEVPILNGE